MQSSNRGRPPLESATIFFRRSACQLAVLFALGASSAGMVAVAQQADSSQSPELQEIVVTGSLIKRTDIETPSPVQVISSADIAQMGYTNVSQVLANLSANGQGTLSQSFGQAFASGASGIALRGLTVGGTLTLIDGKRMVDYPISDDNQRSFVDVSAIPINAIERVEVLKDGASAIYGADAIAGVVNIILKKSYTGAELSAETGTSQKHDGTTEHLAGIFGHGDLDSDGYNVYIAVDWHHQDEILASNRHGGISNLDWSSVGGVNTTPGAVNDPFYTYPASVTGYLLNPTTPNAAGVYPNGLAAQTFLPGCTATQQSLNGCTFNWQGLQIQPSTGQTNILAKFTKSLAGDWTASVSVSDFDSKAEQVCCYYPSTGQNTGGIVNLATAPGVLPTVVSYPAFTVPSTYPGNPYGAAAPLVYNFREIGLPTTLTDTNTYRFIADIKGSLAGWDIDGSVGAMYAKMQLKELNNLDPALAQAALNNGYVIGSGASSTAAQALVPEDVSQPTSSLDIADIHASRALFDLPGGPLALALGAQFFHKTEDDLPPPNVSTGVQEGNSAYALGSQNDAAAFMEFNAQVIKQLEIDGALRYDNYNNGVGGATTPKLSVKYKPIDEFVVRGTWGKGFRAPSSAESGESGNFFGAGNGFDDPILCPNPSNPNAKGNFPSQCSISLTGYQQPGKTLKPVKSTNATFGFIVEPSKTFNLSADYYMIKLTNDIISAEEAGGPSAYTSLVRGPAADLSYCTANGVCSSTATTPAGLIAFVTYPYINAGETRTEGVDLDGQLKFDLGDYGRLTAELNYTHVLNYIEVVNGSTYYLAGTHGPSGISGDTGNPKDRAVLTVGWEEGPVTVQATVNYTSHFSLTDPSSGVETCADGLAYGGTSAYSGRFNGAPSTVIPGYLCTVHTFMDTNLYVNYAVTPQLGIHGTVNNVFDRQAPIDLQTYGGGGQLAYDGSLDQAGAVGRYFLIGASYKFGK